MRLLEIKKQIISEFFSSAGIGCREETLIESFLPAFELLKIQPMGNPADEHESAISAYKALTKGSISFASVLEGEEVLFACARHGKMLSCINFTSPTQTPRFCTLREVKEAFVEAEERGASFKVSVELKSTGDKLLPSLIQSNPGSF